MIGNAHYAKQDYDNAIPAYEKTLDYYDNNDSIYNILGYMYFYKNIDNVIVVKSIRQNYFIDILSKRKMEEKSLYIGL
mgnify:CR=1 FL=1